MAPGMWVQVELPRETLIGGVVLDCAGSPSDYALAYKIELSDDGKTWTKPVAEGKGTPGVMQITFPGAKARFLRITQTGTLAPARNHFWSIHELEILQPGDSIHAGVSPSSSANEPARPREPAQAKPEDLEKMEAALPDTAPAKPLHPRGVLVMWRASK
jgi:endo-1,3(4)-beta-glucanase